MVNAKLQLQSFQTWSNTMLHFNLVFIFALVLRRCHISVLMLPKMERKVTNNPKIKLILYEKYFTNMKCEI